MAVVTRTGMRRTFLALTLLGAAISLITPGRARAGEVPTTEKAIFAGGCFWCMQPPFDHAPGVVSTVVGYAGGSEANPTYHQVSAGLTGHRESIEVTYDPSKTSYEKLLEIFWHNINPIQTNGQFNDIGDQYAAAIFYGTDGQKKAAEESKVSLAKSGKFQKPIAVAILPAGKFWPAEEYHQKYYIKNPTSYGFYHFASGRAAYKKRTWGERP